MTGLEIPEDKRDFLYYRTDTEPGSSGSPCFNDPWELVALHHSGVPDLDREGHILRTDGLQGLQADLPGLEEKFDVGVTLFIPISPLSTNR